MPGSSPATDPSVYIKAIFDPAASAIQKNIYEAWIYQEEFAHDIAVLDIMFDTDSTIEYTTGVPIQISFGRQPSDFRFFFGYVWYTQPMNDFNVGKAHRKVRAVCLGASSIMKDPLTLAFSNQTSTNMMRQVASKYKFSTDVVESNYVWPTTNCPGKTAWEFLIKLANQEGWTLYCYNTDIKFHPRLATLLNPTTKICSFYTRDAKQPETMWNFCALSGDANNAEGSTKATRTAYGIDPSTGQTVTAQSNPPSNFNLAAYVSDPLFNKLESTLVSQSAGQVQQRVQAEAERNRFYIKATAHLNGDVRVAQGVPIALNGVGPKHSGYWFVHKAVHHLQFGSYFMDVEVGRDSTYDQNLRVDSVRGVINNRVTPLGNVSTQKPMTTLNNNTWISTWIPQPQAAIA
jgi:hypothetical protein